MGESYDIRCPWCGHDTMFFGEKAHVRDEVRDDVFSCRGCSAAYTIDEIEEIGKAYHDAATVARGVLEATGANGLTLPCHLCSLPATGAFEERDGEWWAHCP